MIKRWGNSSNTRTAPVASEAEKTESTFSVSYLVDRKEKVKQSQRSLAHESSSQLHAAPTHSPTTPAVTPWKWPVIRTESHPCLVQRLPSPLRIHQAIINPPVNQSIPAAGSRWVSTRDRTKPPLGIDSPCTSSLSHTLLSRAVLFP